MGVPMSAASPYIIGTESRNHYQCTGTIAVFDLGMYLPIIRAVPDTMQRRAREYNRTNIIT